MCEKSPPPPPPPSLEDSIRLVAESVELSITVDCDGLEEETEGWLLDEIDEEVARGVIAEAIVSICQKLGGIEIDTSKPVEILITGYEPTLPLSSVSVEVRMPCKIKDRETTLPVQGTIFINHGGKTRCSSRSN